MQFIRYNLEYNPCKLHPQDAIKELGFKEIHAVPQSLSCCWWFCVEDYNFSIKKKRETDERYNFVSSMKPYSLKYWRDGCLYNCEYFKKFFDEKTQTRNYEYWCSCGEHCFYDEMTKQ